MVYVSPMQKPLTAKQQRIKDFIAHCIQRGSHPTLREICGHFQLALGTVQDHVAALEAKGVVKRDRKRSRGLSLVGATPAPLERRLPILGQIPAGVPIEAIENPDDTVQLDQALAGKADYLLRVKGDSMEPEIYAGDLVLVRQRAFADDGEIVVAQVGDDDATLKRLRRTAREAWLEAANPRYGPIRENFQIAGKIVGLVRRYGRH